MIENEIDSSRRDDFIDGLVQFGLTTEEASVYLSLIRRGNRGEIVGKIKNEVSIGRTTIYAIMERLSQDGWVQSQEISRKPRRIKYVANPPIKIMNKIIKMKKRELEDLKTQNLFIGDKLDKYYQGAKKLSIHTIHKGGIRYLKPLVDSGWKVKSEVVEYDDSEEVLTLDYELKGIMGFPRDSGIIIFIYPHDIESDENIIKDLFDIFKQKSHYEIQQEKIPNLKEIKMENININGYLGFKTSIKLHLKKKWWIIGYQAVIPLKNRVFLIFGNDKNFKILMENILNSEKFHHLV